MKSNGWEVLAIDDVCTVTDCQHSTAPAVDYETEYRMLRTVNIRDGRLRDIETTKSVTEETYKKWSVRGYLEDGDVILTREAPMGEVAILKDEEYKFFLGQRMLQLKVKKEIITPEFLYYSLQTSSMRHQIMMNEGTGSVVSNIRIPLLKKMQISVPSIKLQKKITLLLESIDSKYNNNNSMIKGLEELSQILFKQWFIDFEFPNEDGMPYKSSGGKMVDSEFGEIPEGWNIEYLSSSTEFLSGGTPKTKESTYWNGDIPFFTPKDVGSSVYTTNTEKTITELGLSKCNSRLYPKNTVFITARGTVGKVALANRDMAMNQSCFALKSRNECQFYLYGAIKTLLREIIQGANGAVFNAINLSDLNRLRLAMPQQGLIDKYEAIAITFFDQMSALEFENINLQILRDTLLPKLLSGEIEIPDESVVV
ncbi:restriction endonuclease subunit S [Bacillus coahuilensis]|uniref:restriction endonuclease subunit S n=1 Tax=Bacillus coahuilensis TaxID=408580 RepID=UPI0001850E5C|nr:restriction endonuclease subunit S [Bacillus coahuilensis]